MPEIVSKVSQSEVEVQSPWICLLHHLLLLAVLLLLLLLAPPMDVARKPLPKGPGLKHPVPVERMEEGLLARNLAAAPAPLLSLALDLPNR